MILVPYLKLLRPHQWFKNLLLIFPPFFGGRMNDADVLHVIFPAVLSFSFAASSTYIINDIRDAKSDKNHDHKRKRGVASGVISVPSAAIIAAMLYLAAVLVSSAVSRQFEIFLVLYLLISLAYTFIFKELVLFDIFFIAFGFLIRVLAGGEAFNVPVTKWLFLTVFTVSLLLATGKRLGELISLGRDAHKHRKILTSYSQSFLEGLLWFSASSALVTYALYALEHKNDLFYTVPLAAFGLLRYIYIVKQGKGDPTDALLSDGQIMAAGVLWALMIGSIIYR